jgi:hypothetical protein
LVAIPRQGQLPEVEPTKTVRKRAIDWRRRSVMLKRNKVLVADLRRVYIPTKAFDGRNTYLAVTAIGVPCFGVLRRLPRIRWAGKGWRFWKK